MAKLVQLRAKPCPICAKPADPLSKPFCSAACKNEDLRRWLGGEYRMPTDEQVAPLPGKDETED